MRITRQDWEKHNGHPGHVLWFTGLSGAGKSTLAEALHRQLFATGHQVVLLDGDDLRQGLCQDLGYGSEARTENIRRAGEVAKLFFAQGNIVLCSFISPFLHDRAQVRGLFPAGTFHEIFVSCPLEMCIQRDPKGLYQKKPPQLTGISSPYERPHQPELVVETEFHSVKQSTDLVWQYYLHNCQPKPRFEPEQNSANSL